MLKELGLGKREVKRVESARDLLLAEVHVKPPEIESRGPSHDNSTVREVELVTAISFWSLGAFGVFHRAALVFDSAYSRSATSATGDE